MSPTKILKKPVTPASVCAKTWCGTVSDSKASPHVERDMLEGRVRKVLCMFMGQPLRYNENVCVLFTVFVDDPVCSLKKVSRNNPKIPQIDIMTNRTMMPQKK